MSSKIDPDEHEGLVGTTESRDVGVITRREAQRYARAVEDDNPLFQDPGYAQDQGYDDVVVPPNYLAAIIDPGAGRPADELREDGLDPGRFPIELPPSAVLMGGGQELHFDRYVTAGSKIRMEKTFTDIYQSESDSMGTLTFIERVLEFYNKDDRVLECVTTTIVGDRQ